MVSTLEISESSAANGIASTSTDCLPPGRYRLVAWDIDTTGKRLIDEVCQIAAYTPSSQFAQYVMPHADLNPIARRRHKIRVITVDRFRMMKETKTNKILKTKSEIFALKDFLGWLEETKGDATDGVILIYHEAIKSAPLKLIQSLRQFNLLDRFNNVVKGFANSFKLAKTKCAKTIKTFSLHMLSRVLLDKEADLGNAAERARLTYQIVQHLSQSEQQDLVTEGSGDCSGATNTMIELVRGFSHPVFTEMEDLDAFKKLLICQNTFKPVFGVFLKASVIERQRASKLRRLLAESDTVFEVLEEAWKKSGREGLSDTLKQKVSNANEQEIEELLEIFDCYFDPEKKAVRPKPRVRTSRKQINSKAANSNDANTTENNEENANNKADSSSEATGNAFSDVGSPASSETTPRSQSDEATPSK